LGTLLYSGYPEYYVILYVWQKLARNSVFIPTPPPGALHVALWDTPETAFSLPGYTYVCRVLCI
jgi:hypothetical protein